MRVTSVDCSTGKVTVEPVPEGWDWVDETPSEAEEARRRIAAASSMAEVAFDDLRRVIGAVPTEG